MASAFGSSLIIEELDVTFPGGKPRKLVLVGGGLPRKGGAKWAGDSRIVTTWFVGNGLEASQQALGPTEMPTTFQGLWNRTRMGRAPSIFVDEQGAQQRIVDPVRLWEILDDFRIAAPRLRVTWSVEGSELPGAVGKFGRGTSRRVDVGIVREGRLKVVDVSPEMHTDISWSLEFHWVSRGGRSDRVAQTDRQDDIDQITSSVSDSIDNFDTYTRTAAMVATNARVRNSASNLSLGRLEAVAKGPQQLVDRQLARLRYNANQFKRAAGLAKQVAQTPRAIEKSVNDFATNTTSATNQFVDEFGRLPSELMSSKSKVSDVARAQRFFGRIADENERIGREATELFLRLRREVVTGANRGQVVIRDRATMRATAIIEIHVCKAGDTPARVSTKYYGNPDQIAIVLDANRLPLHTPSFSPGQILVIPALATAPAR